MYRFYLFVVFFCFTFSAFTQEKADSITVSKDPGTAFAKIYANYHLEFDRTDREVAFEITRAYLGYKRNLDSHFSAIVEVDIGSPNDESPYSRLKRYAYFKNAGVTYRNHRLQLGFGLNDIYQFKLQEEFWGYRYIQKSFQDEYKFGSTADIGFLARYELTERFLADVSILNGEGYNQLQLDNKFKYAAGLTFTPVPLLVTRIYSDITFKDVTQSTLVLFLGLRKAERWSLGGEYVYKWNMNETKDHDSWGISTYGTYIINKKWNLFGRFDKLVSVTLFGEDYGWNLANDGSSLVTGIQFTPIDNVHFALNYKDWYPAPANFENKRFLYVNVEIKL
jgi:hypothetical protein